jgi:hypothetical protein
MKNHLAPIANPFHLPIEAAIAMLDEDHFTNAFTACTI